MKSELFKTFICIILSSAFCSSQPLHKQQLFSGKWLFAVDSTKAGEQNNWPEKGIPISISRIVNVPHTWNADTGFEKYFGKAWYQRNFTITKSQIKKLVRLQFDAVYHDATIYINGHKAANHTGSGYTRFIVNVSPFIKQGSNLLTVCADNSFSRNNIPFLNSFDWPNDGGIFRNVYLITTEPNAIESIHVTTVPGNFIGQVNVSIKLLNASDINPKELNFKTRIVEENQQTTNTVYKGNLETKFINGSFIAQFSLAHYKKWHFDHPNLYKIFIDVEINRKKIDESSAVFGFRNIKVENHRLILNGESVRLMGVEWMPGSTLERGMAETREDIENNLTLMKNVNCIYTRFHWQQDDYVFDWCDRHGILIQEEIPYWGSVTVLNDTVVQLGYTQLDEMIDAHYNHPSIISWGIGNELKSRDTLNIIQIKKIYTYAKNLDSSRLVNYVSNYLGMQRSENKNIPDDVSASCDVLMFNEYYSTWQNETIDRVPYHLKKIIEDYPDKPLIISEWGLCEPTFKGGDPRRCREMVQQIKMFSNEPNISGAIYFCLNDYRTQMGEDLTYNYPQRVHGVCDIHLKPKPSFDTLKYISSPVIIKGIVYAENRIMITIIGNTGIPSYTLTNYIIKAGTTRKTIKKLEPGQELTLDVDKNAKELIIKRPTGFEVLRIKL